MKKLLITLLISSNLFAQNPMFHLSQQQYQIMKKTWDKAKKFDLQYTMTAIAWVESKFGKYLIDLNDPSCGVFHIMPSTINSNKWKQSRICERLIKDYDFSFSVALERFKFFYNYWRSKGYSKQISWKRAVCSYNAGYNWKKGLKYYKKVVKTIKQIKQFMLSLD